MRDRPGTAGAAGLGVLLLALGALAGCSDGQDPGVTPDDRGPRQTSDTLGTCPPGGPDATTAPAGCIDEEGRVRRPEGTP